MAVRTDLGQRVELVSMDPRFHDISVGLYRKETADGPVAVVHSYCEPAGHRRAALRSSSTRSCVRWAASQVVDGDADRAVAAPVP